MKKIITAIFIMASITIYAQTKTITQALITTKTTIITPEGEEDNVPPPPLPGGGEEIRVMRFGGDGETKSVTTIKGNMVKTFTENEMSRTTVLRDNEKKTTTTLLEMMGNKTGFFATDDDQAEMNKRMDSLMQSSGRTNLNAIVNNDIIYFDETKKVAGQVCKKAILINTRKNGIKDSNTIWFCPDFKLQGIISTGGISGFGGMGRATSLEGLIGLAGFPMQYEMKMNRGRKMIVEVTKINFDKEIAEKDFEIPKDFVVKPIKEMQGAEGGRIQIRIGGPN